MRSGYNWKPSRDWERLRELEKEVLDDTWSSEEVVELAKRTWVELGFESLDSSLATSRQAQAAYVLAARNRIRDGSRRLGALLIELEDLADAGDRETALIALDRFLATEPVNFYREIAEGQRDMV